MYEVDEVTEKLLFTLERFGLGDLIFEYFPEIKECKVRWNPEWTKDWNNER